MLRTVWLGVLYLAGLGVWGYALGWSQLPFDFGDWGDINVPRLLFVSNAIQEGKWPLHMLNTHSLHGVTDRFLTLPDVITTPQMLLLPWLGVQRFVLFDVLLHYTFGVLGLLALRRRLQWSLFTYTIVFALFSFNGQIVSQYSVGHFTWAAYFLFPAIVTLLIDFLDRRVGWRWVARFAAVMGYAVLAGGQHHFTWVLLLVGCLLPFALDRAKWLVAAVLASGLVSAVRLLPPMLSLQAFADTGWINDVIGYPSIRHVLTSMIELRREDLALESLALPGNFLFFERNYFEYNFYVGVIGAAVILYFGIYSWLKDREPAYPQLIVPTFALIAMSIGTVFRLVRATGLPLIMSERIVSRMLSLPMTILIVIAGVLLQRLIRRQQLSVWNQLGALALLVLMTIDIAAGVRLLRVPESARSMPRVPFETTTGQLAFRDDPLYERTAISGAAITIVTAAGLLTLAARERRAKAAES